MSATSHVNSPTRLASDYLSVREATVRLAWPLSAEDQMVQSMPDCSPTKWHLAHTTWFFETFLLSHQPGYAAYDERFREVFNSYYKQLGNHPFRGDRGHFSRPSLDQVLTYRARVDEAMLKMLASELPPDAAALVELGLNHEQQHQELIVTDILHAFYSQPLRPAYVDAPREQKRVRVPELTFTRFEAGTVAVGHSDAATFAFDNETPRHQVVLRPFRIANRIVTNAEYLEFIEDGGYRRPELWLSDGWDTVASKGWSAPLYWDATRDGFRVFTSSGTRKLDDLLSVPACHVSFYEADAYARWRGMRLATEFEWEHAAASVTVEGTFAEGATFAPASAAQSDSLQQMFGEVWQWTASPYIAYPGFRPAAGAVGEYNGKFMCNQLVLRGGSCATPRSHIRRTYRNFFAPHARWQFMGIRLADDER